MLTRSSGLGESVHLCIDCNIQLVHGLYVQYCRPVMAHVWFGLNPPRVLNHPKWLSQTTHLNDAGGYSPSSVRSLHAGNTTSSALNNSPPMRVYAYEVNEHGQLFLSGTKHKNFTSCYSSVALAVPLCFKLSADLLYTLVRSRKGHAY